MEPQKVEAYVAYAVSALIALEAVGVIAFIVTRALS